MSSQAPTFDILERRKQAFTLWLPDQQGALVELILTTFVPNDPMHPAVVFQGSMLSTDTLDLYEATLDAISSSLSDEQIYHYWFQITNTSEPGAAPIKVTDPLAYTVDYRTVGDRTASDANVQPASVIKFRDGQLRICDLDGTELSAALPPQPLLPDNSHMVIYELPTSWASASSSGGVETDTGTFKDVLALFDVTEAGDRFKNIPTISGEAIVADLGTNALELLPAADAKPIDQWGYATAQYYAPDFDFGTTSTGSDLVRLVNYIHNIGVRYFQDVVMAFGHDPYVEVAFQQFHIDPRAEPNNPDSYQSHGQGLRDGWGGSSWRYIQSTNTYDPQTGATTGVKPSWAFHKGHLHHWMTYFGIDGLRLDSVNNIGSYDFLKAYKDYAWLLYQQRYAGNQTPPSSKFLVIGEELSDPVDMVEGPTKPLDALWNEIFKQRIRQVILGNGARGDNFEWTVRKMIDCRLDTDHAFTDLAQSVIYITSHDVGGFGNERLYNYLLNSNISDADTMLRRAKLAYACLLTAVGIPMIFAGEEFLDIQDNFYDQDQKQTDPVNYNRLSDSWRRDLFNYLGNLVRLRQECPALGVNDTEFIHVDWDGKIMAWKRGSVGQQPVIVVANFSDADTPGTEYDIGGWPDANRDDWREVTQNRQVPQAWVGKEPLMHWEVKIYTYWASP